MSGSLENALTVTEVLCSPLQGSKVTVHSDSQAVKQSTESASSNIKEAAILYPFFIFILNSACGKNSS
jgi:hypothetical protein